MSNRTPAVVIGVDFGMACCGVAYANLTSRSDNVLYIQKWPGRAQASENKVPTSIVYSKSDQCPLAWGFASDAAYAHNADADYKEWFKVLLDPEELAKDQHENPELAPRSMEEVETLYIDFLRLLYDHIESQLATQLYDTTWQDSTIDFIFSIPTTCTDKSVVEKFRSLIIQAGFTRYRGHTVDIGFTEAEAAAVQVSKRDRGIFKEKDVLLVCDAGGGTTDLSIQRVESIRNNNLSLKQLDVVQGRTIGSATIDAEFERLAHSKLQKANESISLGLSELQIHNISWALMKSSEYQNTKCEFGSKLTQPFTTFTLPVRELPQAYVNEQYGIHDQCVTFERTELQQLFDNQLGKLFNLIDHQFADVERKLPGQQVTHFILSGGLGNSPYVLQQLKARYEMGGTQKFQSTESLRILVAPEPQLAVCKGLVDDRVQRLSTGQAVLGWRCCRESYGVGYKELYDPTNPLHSNRQTAIDEADGRLYITDGIDWMVKAGDMVSADQPISHDFFRTIAENDTARCFSTNIFVSTAQDTRRLPNYLAPGFDIKQLCTIQSDLSFVGVEHFEQKGRQPWSRKRPHYLVRYQIKAIIGPGDLRFELWFKDKKVNIDQAIHVEWFRVSESTEPQAHLPSPPNSLQRPLKPVAEPQQPSGSALVAPNSLTLGTHGPSDMQRIGIGKLGAAPSAHSQQSGPEENHPRVWNQDYRAPEATPSSGSQVSPNPSLQSQHYPPVSIPGSYSPSSQPAPHTAPYPATNAPLQQPDPAHYQPYPFPPGTAVESVPSPNTVNSGEEAGATPNLSTMSNTSEPPSQPTSFNQLRLSDTNFVKGFKAELNALKSDFSAFKSRRSASSGRNWR